MKRTLSEINADYESILHSSALTNDQKAVKFADLLTEMERSHKVPMLRNPEWESRKKAAIALFRKISLSRAINN